MLFVKFNYDFPGIEKMMQYCKQTYDFLVKQLGEPTTEKNTILITYNYENDYPEVIEGDDHFLIKLRIESDDIHMTYLQIAHELCHIFIDDKVRTNNFIEIVCQKTALDVVECLGEAPNSTNYVQRFKEDALDLLKLKYDNLDLKWVKEQIIDLEQKDMPYEDRELKNLIAFKLKDVLDEPNKFGLITWLNNYVNKYHSDNKIPNEINFNNFFEIINDYDQRLARLLDDLK